MIDAYSTTGFKLNNGVNIYGPLVMLPRTVLHWNVANINEISIDSLTLFHLLEPKPDILIIGVGDSKNVGKFNTDIIRFMSKKGIHVDALSTDKACPLYNLLSYEKRLVVGAFLPPNLIQYSTRQTEYLGNADKLFEIATQEADENMDQLLKEIEEPTKPEKK